jgi:hypothetical protein
MEKSRTLASGESATRRSAGIGISSETSSGRDLKLSRLPVVKLVEVKGMAGRVTG